MRSFHYLGIDDVITGDWCSIYRTTLSLRMLKDLMCHADWCWCSSNSSFDRLSVVIGRAENRTVGFDDLEWLDKTKIATGWECQATGFHSDGNLLRIKQLMSDVPSWLVNCQVRDDAKPVPHSYCAKTDMEKDLTVHVKGVLYLCLQVRHRSTVDALVSFWRNQTFFNKLESGSRIREA